jgi:hypothetical protein
VNSLGGQRRVRCDRDSIAFAIRHHGADGPAVADGAAVFDGAAVSDTEARRVHQGLGDCGQHGGDGRLAYIPSSVDRAAAASQVAVGPTPSSGAGGANALAARATASSDLTPVAAAVLLAAIALAIAIGLPATSSVAAVFVGTSGSSAGPLRRFSVTAIGRDTDPVGVDPKQPRLGGPSGRIACPTIDRPQAEPAGGRRRGLE